MAEAPPRRLRRWWIALGVFFILALAGAWYFRGDILATALDPKVPFQTYRPPPAPDYAQREAWALYPAGNASLIVPNTADVFFIHPTVYDGGSEWVGPIPHERTDVTLYRTMLPNYAGPFARLGRVFAPRYRHASLYALMRPYRDDAREAQEFAYEDVRRAFLSFLTRSEGPFILAGAEQGGLHATRLLRDVIAPDLRLRQRLVAVYLAETLVPADEYGPAAPIQACARPDQIACVLAWSSVISVDLPSAARTRDDALVWTRRRLERFGDRPALCVNPLVGVQTTAPAAARQNRGAANATGLEWGARPAFLVHQVSARCVEGLLFVSRPRSSSLRRSGGWSESLLIPNFNLFYADTEADAQRRITAWWAAIPPPSAAPRAASRTAPAAPAAPGPAPTPAPDPAP